MDRLHRILDIPVGVRRSVTWAVGVCLGTWETIAHDPPRAIVYAFVGALIGLPEGVERATRLKKELSDDDPAPVSGGSDLGSGDHGDVDRDSRADGAVDHD